MSSTSFAELIRLREQQHNERVQELVDANNELSAKLHVALSSGSNLEERVAYLENLVLGLDSTLKQNAARTSHMLSTWREEYSDDTRRILEAVAQQTLSENNKNNENNNNSNDNTNTTLVTDDAVDSLRQDIARVSAELSDTSELALSKASRALEHSAECVSRIEGFEGSCFQRMMDVQVDVMSSVLSGRCEDACEAYLQQHSVTLSVLGAALRSSALSEERVEGLAMRLEQYQTDIENSYPQLGDERVDLMVAELQRSAMNMESIVAHHARQASAGGGDELVASLAEVEARVDDVEESMTKLSCELEALRVRGIAMGARLPSPKNVPRVGPSMQHVDLYGSVSPGRLVVKDESIMTETEDSGATPNTMRYAVTKDVAAGASAKSTPRGGRRTPKRRPSPRTTPRGGAKGVVVDGIIVDATASIANLEAQLEDVEARRTEREAELEGVNEALGHMQAEFLRLTERESELTRLPHTAEWRERLAADPSRDAESLRGDLAQLQAKLSSAKESVYQRERAIMEQRNDLWREVAGLDEEVAHIRRQIAYYRDVDETERALASAREGDAASPRSAAGSLINGDED